MSFKQQSAILSEWAQCMCGINSCNWPCDWVVIEDIIDSAVFNPGNAPGFLTNDGTGSLSWTDIPFSTFLTYYFQDTASGIAGDKKQLTSTYSPLTQLSFSGVTDNQLLQTWATDPGSPGITFIPSGVFEVNIHSAQIGGTKAAQLYCKINEVNSSGTFIATIATTGYTSILTGSNTDHFCTVSTPTGYTLASSSSRIVTEVYAHVTGGGSAPQIELYYGDGSDSRTEIPSTSSFGGILGPSQGGTGQDFSAATGVQQWSSGTASVSTALANGTTATTQSALDNSTKIATTAYVDRAVPQGAWTDFSGSVAITGNSGSPTITFCKYITIGKTCTYTFSIAFTSNAAAHTITLPFASKNACYFLGWVGDNATANSVLLLTCTASSATASLFKNTGANNFSSTGTVTILLTMTYETT